jgi:DNA-binding MarR family transcriptional regulator
MGAHRKPAPAADGGGGATEPGVTAILDSIRRIVRVLRVASRAAEKQVGLSAAQLFVLHVLADRPAQSLNEVAQRTRTHQSSVSVVVQRLVDRGLVARSPVPGDARRTMLSIIPSARRLLRGAPDTPTERLIAAVERMPPPEQLRLAKSLSRLVKELGAADEPATMLFEDDASPASSSRAPTRRSGRQRTRSATSKAAASEKLRGGDGDRPVGNDVQDH